MRDNATDAYLNLATQQPFFYFVRQGDSLSGIIYRHYNVLPRDRERYAYAEAHLCYLNGLNNPNHIQIGRVLYVTPLPEIATLTELFKLPADITTLPALADTSFALPRLSRTLPVTLTTKAEQDMFWGLSWLQNNSDWLTVPSDMLTDAAGRMLHEDNIALLREVKALYETYKAGRFSKGQYDYRRQLALKQFSDRVGPLERLMFSGRTTQEAIRIARAGGIPATYKITMHAARLAKVARVARYGAPVVLTGVSLAAGCMQIAATDNRVEKNEIFFETAVSTGIGLALGALLFSNPVGWGLMLVLVAGSAAASYWSGQGARSLYNVAYDKYGQQFDLDAVSLLKIDSVCR